MSETVTLPALGESVTEGTVTRWLKEVGDQIEVDDPIVEVSTDKVDTEIPSPVAGVLEEILVDEDETIEVGADLARVGEGGSSGDSASAEESADEQPAEEESAPAEQSEEAPTQEAAEAPAESSDDSSSGETSEVPLPALGESVTEGTVTRWLKEIGEEVAEDEPLLEVSTDKVDTEIPSPVAGKLVEIKIQEDETAEVGDVLALVGTGAAPSGGSAPESEPAQESAPSEEEQETAPAEEEQDAPAEKPKAEEREPAQQEAPAEPKAEEPSSAPSQSEAKSSQSTSASEENRGDGYVTPLVRRLARQHDVDLSQVKGTGVGGRIRKQDVLEAAKTAEAPAAEPAESKASAAAAAPASSVDPGKRGTTEKAPRIRQVIARRMKESLEVSAQLTQVHEVDLTRVVALRSKAKTSFQQNHGVKLTYLPFITQTVAEALKQHPKVNATFDEDAAEITYHDTEDVAIAVDTERGLLVPVINDAGSLNLSGIAGRIDDLAERTRTNKISPNELSGGTFSITNIGSVGALIDTPIINQPQVAILGTGTITKRPMVLTDDEGNDSIAIRHIMYLSLTYDHRLVDGADAGRFLQTIKARLEAGEFANELGL